MTGDGAAIHGHRWNPQGMPAVYTAESRSLAALEILVHYDSSDAPDNLVLVTIEIPGDIRISRLDGTDLPADWQSIPHNSATQEVGRRWLISGTSAVLSVPSVVMPAERNYILNPRHPNFAKIVLVDNQPFSFDFRLHRKHKA